MNDLNKLNYKELSEVFENIDYQKFIKALFYYEKKDSLANLNEKECDEVLNNCYEFFMESVDGTFLNENIDENFYELLDNYSHIDEEEINKNFKEKEEQENLNNLFEQDSLGNFIYIEQKQNDILEDIKEQEIINNLKKSILQFDNFHPLQKCNFGTMMTHMHTSYEKLSENLKLYINHPDLKVITDYDQFSVIKYNEGSGKVLADDLKLKLEIIDKNKTFKFKFEIPYDTISFEKDENGYIIYNPSQIKINENVLNKALNEQKIFKHIKNYLGEKNGTTNIEYGKHSGEFLSRSEKSDNELLQKNANNISLSMESNIGFKYEDSRVCGTQKTSQEVERDRLSEIAISPILSDYLQNLSQIRAKTERNYAISKELDLFQKRLANTLLELNLTNNTEEKLSKALSIYETFGENFTKKDLNTKLNDKLDTQNNFNSDEKDKIINDYILAVSSNNHHLIKEKNLDKLINIVDEKLQDLKNNKNNEIILILEENINDIKNCIRKIND